MTQASVFIVDDDADVRRSLQCVLQSETRRIVAYGSAAEFLANSGRSIRAA